MTVWTPSQQVTKRCLCTRLWPEPLLRSHTVLRPDLRLRPKGAQMHFDAYRGAFCSFKTNTPPVVHTCCIVVNTCRQNVLLLYIISRNLHDLNIVFMCLRLTPAETFLMTIPLLTIQEKERGGIITQGPVLWLRMEIYYYQPNSDWNTTWRNQVPVLCQCYGGGRRCGFQTLNSGS